MTAQFLLLGYVSICLHMQIAACETECVKKDSKNFILTAGTYPYSVSAGAASKSTKLKNLMADGKNQLDVPMPQSIMPLTVFCMEQFHDCRNLQGKALLDQVYERAVAFLKPILKTYNQKDLLNLKALNFRSSSAFESLSKKWPIEFSFLIMAAADYLQHQNLYKLATRQASQALQEAKKTGSSTSYYKYAEHIEGLEEKFKVSFAYKDIDRWHYLLGDSSSSTHGYSISELQEYGKLPAQIQSDTLRSERIASLEGLNCRTARDLVDLNVSSNVLTKLSSSDPLPQNLETLNLSDNLLQDVNLQHLTRLQKILLATNPLCSFTLPPQITHLSIACNNLETIDTSMYSRLASLDLSGNKLTQLGLPLSLRTLLVENNKATAHFDLSTLTNLQELSLSYRYQSERQPFKIISYPPCLRSLSFQTGMCKTISGRTLPDTLRYLNAHNNFLTRLHISHLTQLQNLNASSNKLTSINPLTIPTTLTRLDLFDNKLTDENKRELNRAFKFINLTL